MAPDEDITRDDEDAVHGENQYLSFLLDGEVFAIEIPRVREVMEHISLTTVPRMPDFVRGVINLRGRIVPVVDLRRMFDMGETVIGEATCIVMVEAEVEDGAVLIGALADSVREVIDLGVEHIERAPAFGARVDTVFLKGLARQEQELLMVLDIDRVFSAAEARLIAEADRASAQIAA